LRSLFRLAVPVLVLVAAGCCGATDATKTMAGAVVRHFDLIRTEGKTWTDDQWDARLRQYQAEAATVNEFVATGTLSAGAALRHRRESRGD
jgi:hypothetical protein